MTRPETETATTKELVLPEGCLVCGGDLPVRVTASGAYAVCKACGWFSRPVVVVKQGGLEVHYRTAQA
jgi:hypothetical protein